MIIQFSKSTVLGVACIFAGLTACGGGNASRLSSLPNTSGLQNSERVERHTTNPLSLGPPGATRVFWDDFVAGTSTMWTVLAGRWAVCRPPGRSSEYCTTSPAGQTGDVLSTAGSSAWTDYEVDAWMIPASASSNSGVELVGRFADSEHFYQLELRTHAGAQSWGIHKVTSSGWTNLVGGPFSYVTGGYYHVRFQLTGTALTAYATTRANDWSTASEQLLGTVTDATYTHGSIAVRAIGGIAARFDDIAVYAVQTPAPATDPRLILAPGFHADTIANVGGARELAVAPNGDLLVGTNGQSIAVVPNAESGGAAGAPQTLITLPEGPAQGIALGPAGTLYAATNTAVWKIPYVTGNLSTSGAKKIAAVRSGPVAPGSDGDVHGSSSVSVSGTAVYVGVGSSCNACTEVDPTRASVQRMGLDGENMTTYATRIRNPIAFAVNPVSGMVWTGGAGQDFLPAGHPYEYLDDLTAHPARADYGWPACEENHIAYIAGSDCSRTVAPAIEFPAYSTIIGATFYPPNATGAYAFPTSYRGGLFVSMHGSWHTSGGVPIDAPHVAFVPMNGDTPATAVDWATPTKQWTEFFTGFQAAGGNRIGRTTGIAVGPQGSLFVADDQTGNIYRIRPGSR